MIRLVTRLLLFLKFIGGAGRARTDDDRIMSPGL
ncbi:MAG: hypothetical protein RL129_485 [Actinomycetota bacterium]